MGKFTIHPNWHTLNTCVVDICIFDILTPLYKTSSCIYRPCHGLCTSRPLSISETNQLWQKSIWNWQLLQPLPSQQILRGNNEKLTSIFTIKFNYFYALIKKRVLACQLFSIVGKWDFEATVRKEVVINCPRSKKKVFLLTEFLWHLPLMEWSCTWPNCVCFV